MRERIASYSPRWPICMYAQDSKRYKSRSEPSASKLIQTIDLFMPLTGWHTYPEIAIDGMNGTGKSTLIRLMKRHYVKTNEFVPHVTTGSRYNHDMIKSLQYMMLQPNTICENVCWDRCRYSNLCFYYVHYLMYIYRDRVMPTDSAEVLMHLNQLAISTNLLQTLMVMESIKRTPTIFFVCSDFEMIGEALRRRDTPNDIYNAKELNYQIAQYHAYNYFAEILRYPVFDLAKVFAMDMTLGEFHQLLIRKIDTGRTEFSVTTPPIEHSTKFNTLYDDIAADETLIYDYSNK